MRSNYRYFEGTYFRENEKTIKYVLKFRHLRNRKIILYFYRTTMNSEGEEYFSVLTNGNRITIIKNIPEDLTGEIEVFNLLGQVITREKYLNEEAVNMELNTTGGEYIIRIITKGYIFTSKIIINKI